MVAAGPMTFLELALEASSVPLLKPSPRRMMMGGYVTGTRATDGATLPEGIHVDYPLSSPRGPIGPAGRLGTRRG